MNTYHVYIMASASRVLYTGVTSDIQRRVSQHREKQVPDFSARYNVRESSISSHSATFAWPSPERNRSRAGCELRRCPD